MANTLSFSALILTYFDNLGVADSVLELQPAEAYSRTRHAELVAVSKYNKFEFLDTF